MSDFKDRGTDAVLGATTVAGSAKFLHDINRPLQVLRQSNIKADALRTGPKGIANDIKALDLYSDMGSTALNSRVLGTRLPYYGVRELNPVVEGKYVGLGKAMFKDRGRFPFMSRNSAVAGADVLSDVMTNAGVSPQRGGFVERFIGRLRGRTGYLPGSDIDKSLEGIRESRKHYDIFANKGRGDITKHLLDEAFTTRIPEAMKRQLGSDVWNIINSKRAPIGTASYVGELMRAAKTPEARDVIKHTLGEAAKTNVLGAANRMSRYRRIGGIAGGLAGGAGLATGVLGLGMLYRALGFSGKKPETPILPNIKVGQLTQDDADTAGLGVVGAGMVGHGVHTMARPLDVGITWGERPVWGQGHKGPGKVLNNLLTQYQTDPRSGGFRLTQAIRGADGVVAPKQVSRYNGIDTMRNVRGRKFDVLFDTGMGSGIPGAWAGDMVHPNSSIFEKIRYNISRPSARMGGHVAYMTDVAKGDMAGQTTSGSSGKGSRTRGTGFLDAMRRKFMPNTLKDTFLTYGTPGIVKDNPEFINMRTNNLATPLLDRGAVENLRGLPGRNNILDEILTHPELKLTDANRKLLSDLKTNGKRVLVISGSGRGDQVSVKALRTQATLKRMGLADKVQVVALNAGADKYTPFAKLVQKHPDIIDFGFIPNKVFTRIPGLADLNWGSTGTSSLYESLATPVPFAQTADAERWRKLEMRAISRKGLPFAQEAGLAKNPGELDQLLKSLGRVELDKWNAGNKMLAKSVGGAHELQTPKQVIDTLMAQSPATMHRATSRAKAMQRALIDSQESLSSTHFPAIFQRALRHKLMRGAGWAGLGSALIGGGAYRLAHRNDPPQVPAGSSVTDRLRSAMQGFRAKLDM
jgi:hypothetical protein